VDADTFTSGDGFLDALSSLPSFSPDCVILDVQMPGLNGLEVQRRLSGSGMPVIFITAHDDIGVREQALSAGAVAYLRKPFDDELFIRIVRSVLGIAPQRKGRRSIGNEAHQTLQDADLLLKQLNAQVLPQARQTLASAQAALDSANSALEPNSALAQNTTDAMRELARTAAAFRTLADYLERHPEALIRGKQEGAK
jgi:FixJ family two-component response regulator